MPSVFIKSLRPRVFRVKGYRDSILDALKQEGREIRNILDGATSTWTPRVRFRTDVRVSGNVAEMKVSTKDVRFINVDKGTKKRWAVMSNPYSPKSQVRSLSASQGMDKPVIRGKAAMTRRGIAPRPGIKARKFSVEARKIRRPLFFKNMRKAMKDAAKGSF